jgi:predicted small secreted protein
MITKILLLLGALAVGSASLTACNTIQGAGRDIEKAGSKLQDEAQEHKRY